jgi:hypothetical protein
MPRAMLNYAAKKLTQGAMRNDSVRTTLSAFTRIEPGEDGTLILMFDPRDVNTVVRILKSAGQDPGEETEEDDDSDDTDDENEEDAAVGEDRDEEDAF